MNKIQKKCATCDNISLSTQFISNPGTYFYFCCHYLMLQSISHCSQFIFPCWCNFLKYGLERGLYFCSLFFSRCSETLLFFSFLRSYCLVCILCLLVYFCFQWWNLLPICCFHQDSKVPYWGHDIIRRNIKIYCTPAVYKISSVDFVFYISWNPSILLFNLATCYKSTLLEILIWDLY